MYIVFEGIDGAGKTTLIEKIAEWLKEEWLKVKVVREPSRIFEESLNSRDHLIFNDEAWLTLAYAIDRLEIHDNIQTYLKNEHIVLSDRSYISSLVYQEHTDFVRHVNGYAIKPDIIIFLDVPAEFARERIIQRDGIEKAPSVETLEKLRKEYLDILNYDDCDHSVFGVTGFFVDASKSQEDMLEGIKPFLKNMMLNWRDGIFATRHFTINYCGERI